MIITFLSFIFFVLSFTIFMGLLIGFIFVLLWKYNFLPTLKNIPFPGWKVFWKDVIGRS